LESRKKTLEEREGQDEIAQGMENGVSQGSGDLQEDQQPHLYRQIDFKKKGQAEEEDPQKISSGDKSQQKSKARSSGDLSGALVGVERLKYLKEKIHKVSFRHP
jgi:hypothetical protein